MNRNVLAEHLAEARSDGLRFAVLTVLLTPAFLAVGVFLLILGAWYADPGLLRGFGYHRSFLTFMNLFFLIGFIAFFARPKAHSRVSIMDLVWVGAALVILGLIAFVSYGTPMAQAQPRVFWPIYAVLTFTMLGLLGHAYEPRDDYYLGWFNGWMDNPFTLEDDIDRAHVGLGIAAAVPRAILDAYASIFGSTWLIRPLDDQEIKIAADLLVSIEKPAPGEKPRASDKTMARVLRVLTKTDLIYCRKTGVSLTLEGRRVVSLF